jgi:membrane-bound lytic murein transglycosylase B
MHSAFALARLEHMTLIEDLLAHYSRLVAQMQDDLKSFESGRWPGAGYQPGEANFAAIQAWNAAPVYQRAIALVGRQIDGGEGTSARP